MAEPVPPRSEGGFKGALKRPIGPLPTWGWVLVLALVVIGWAWWHNRSTQKAAASADTGQSSQVPEFVNQNYTTLQPPVPPQPPPGDHDKDDRRRKRRRHPTHDPDQMKGGKGGGGDTGTPPARHPAGALPSQGGEM